MFYKKGIDISNTKSMYNFLKDHYEYYTLNSWNGLKSIANNVKVYNLNLDGDCWRALELLDEDEYYTVNDMIYDFERTHKYCSVGFNGRSGGYLVLYNKDNNCSVLPSEIENTDDYEDFKDWCKDYYGSVREYKSELRWYTQLVRDFDKLCDDIRNYVNKLSKM